MTDSKKANEMREIILAKVTTRGLSGLSNMGNTCYMNAALQTLSVTKPLISYFLSPRSSILNNIESRILKDKYTEHEKYMKEVGIDEELEVDPDEVEREIENTLTYKLKMTFNAMWKRNCKITPRTVKSCVDELSIRFNGSKQHDSHDLLNFIIDRTHEEIKGDAIIDITDSNEIENKMLLDSYYLELDKALDQEGKKTILDKIYDMDKKNNRTFLSILSTSAWRSNLKNAYSVINDIFSGQSLSTIICKECKNISYKFERFDVLTLHLPSMTQTEYKLEELLKAYVLDEELTGENKYNCCYCATKTDAVKSNIIYQQPSTLVLMIKKWDNVGMNDIKINYGHELNMEPYMHEYSNNNKLYELYATIKYSGNGNVGHYYTYAKNPINDLWFLHDDGNVYNVEDDEPLKCNGYILFYRQKI